MQKNTKLEESLNKLNKEQRLAATNYEGAYFILAGPGSGKTATIVQRIAYMINEGVPPEKIMLFTFTNKAANELKERTVKIVGDKALYLTVGTYHSVCARLLRKYCGILGIESNFTIYDTNDSISILKPKCKKEMLDVKQVISYISSCKNNMIGPEEAYNKSKTSFQKRMAEMYASYQKSIRKQNAMDFDDLIWNMVKVMELDNNVLTELNERFHYIISDESHDSNPRDLRLIELLAGYRKNVCFVLDPNQSIYGFRGADINAVLNIPAHYDNLTTYQLKKNYRSSQNIVDASEKLISHNRQPQGRVIEANNGKGEDIYYLEGDDVDHEASRIVTLIKALKEQGEEYKEMAILMRMNYLSRPLEKALAMAKIPFEVKSSTGFFERIEIKDVMSYVRLIYNPHDYAAIKRIINVPKRGIGEKSFEIIANARKRKQPYTETIKEVNDDLKGKAKKGSLEFVEIMESLMEIKNNGAKPHEILDAILEKTKYLDYLADREEDLKILQDRRENLTELINMSYEYMTLDEMLMDISLYTTPEEEDEDADKVQLMTIHSSKGLEWNNVIMLCSNETIIPHKKEIDNGDITEERRLYYVGVTRARKKLFMTRPKVMFNFGRNMTMRKSRFVNEMGNDVVEI